MAILVTCEACKQTFRVRDEYLDKKAWCPACRAPITLTGERVPNHEVFISYSNKDKHVADAICAKLEALPLRCWIAPRDVAAGHSWGSSIIEAIEEAKVMVLVYSGSSNLSPQVIREVERAVSKGLVLVPFRIEATMMSKDMEYFLSASHWIDALTPPLEKHLVELGELVRTVLFRKEKEAAAAQKPVQPAKPGPTAPASTNPASQPKSRNKLWIAAAVALVAVLGMAGWWFGPKALQPPNQEAGATISSMATAPAQQNGKPSDSSVTAAVSEPAKKAHDPASTKGLVLHYDFAQEEPGGKITDTSEIGNHGRVTGAQWISTEGNGGAYEFAAGGDVIRPPNNDQLNCEYITVSVWIKTSCIDEYWRDVFLKDWDKGYGLGTIGDWREFKSRGIIRFNVSGNTAVLHHYTDSDISIADGQWHHIAATYDGEIQWLYVDGKPQSVPNEWKGKILSTKVGLTIGNCMAPRNENAFRGTIGELMIYSRALSAEEISHLYSSQKVKYPTASVSVPMPAVAPQPAVLTTTPATIAPSPAPQTGQRWTNSLGMVFVPVPGTAVRFSIWDTRVQDYQAYVAATGHPNEAKNTPHFEQGPTHPVSFVGWKGCKAFCAWLTEKERREGRIRADQFYRLPTDLEWSTAVGLKDEPGHTAAERNGKIRDVYPWGTTWPPPRGAGNYGSRLHIDDFANTSPVGIFAPNRFGLYDMGGNVHQWCDEVEDGMHIMRGGSWKTGRPEDALLSHRWFWPGAVFRDPGFGFRCVLASGDAPTS